MRTSILLMLAVTLVFTAGPHPARGAPGEPVPRMEDLDARQAYCPHTVLAVGGIIIRGDRCYTLLVLRDARGIFLAFADPSVKIPPGQLVRLRTPAGAKVKGRIFYLVPLRVSPGLVPLDAVVPAAARVTRSGSQVTIIITSLGPGASVVFRIKT